MQKYERYKFFFTHQPSRLLLCGSLNAAGNGTSPTHQRHKHATGKTQRARGEDPIRGGFGLKSSSWGPKKNYEGFGHPRSQQPLGLRLLSLELLVVGHPLLHWPYPGVQHNNFQFPGVSGKILPQFL